MPKISKIGLKNNSFLIHNSFSKDLKFPLIFQSTSSAKDRWNWRCQVCTYIYLPPIFWENRQNPSRNLHTFMSHKCHTSPDFSTLRLLWCRFPKYINTFKRGIAQVCIIKVSWMANHQILKSYIYFQFDKNSIWQVGTVKS